MHFALLLKQKKRDVNLLNWLDAKNNDDARRAHIHQQKKGFRENTVNLSDCQFLCLSVDCRPVSVLQHPMSDYKLCSWHWDLFSSSPLLSYNINNKNRQHQSIEVMKTIQPFASV